MQNADGGSAASCVGRVQACMLDVKHQPDADALNQRHLPSGCRDWLQAMLTRCCRRTSALFSCPTALATCWSALCPEEPSKPPGNVSQLPT